MRPVLFDFDGTLADSAPIITESYILTLREKQNKDYPPEFFRPFIGPPLEDTFALLGADDVAAYVRTYRAFYAQRMHDTQLFPGILDMLATLKQAGVPMAVATSKRTDYACELSEHLGVSQYVEAVCGSSEDLSRAQKRHRVEDALSELASRGVPASNSIMVGDRIHDVEGAAANGLDTVLVRWGEGTEAEFARAWRVVATVEELTALLLQQQDM
ncbi:MAG: HAD hydrolase-like protein [Ancrocorticia sp.]|uniref:HAD hydrolase-like protein n=1 Tax=Ancrocorticia sp. TaxID=2593684 RepID=UPI003F915A7D